MAIKQIQEIFERGAGILQMQPNFLPVRFGKPGRRLRLHPDDYYSYGVSKGAISERWFSSPIAMRKSKGSTLGISYVSAGENWDDRFLFSQVIAELGSALVGETLMADYGGWPIFAKFFDYADPLYLHFHPNEKLAARVGCLAKPECYYFPAQYNNHVGSRPSTYIGLNPEVTREQVKKAVADFPLADNHVLQLSKAYALTLDTGWYVPPGVLHAPGSLLTYEPQWATDLNCVVENVVCDEPFPESFRDDICPEDAGDPVEYILNALDFPENLNPDFKKEHFCPPVPCSRQENGGSEEWICYKNKFTSAKKITVFPGAQMTVTDKAAYGCVVIQGFGRFAAYPAEAVGMIRFGEMSADEFFVSKQAAESGVCIKNHSQTEPMVILQHFGPDGVGLVGQ